MKKVFILCLVMVMVAGLASGCSLIRKAQDVKEQVDEIGGALDYIQFS